MHAFGWRAALSALAALLLVSCSENGSGTAAQAKPFDFYVLSLSWSPGFCAGEDNTEDSPQCRPGQRHGFIVHGLWPQFETGYPEFCASGDEAGFSRPEIAALQDIMPSPGLIRHQWRKHGTCSGLSREDYFATLRAAFERVRIPERYRKLTRPLTIPAEEVEAEFIAANAGLDTEGISIACTAGTLREVRICMTSELEFRPCPELERRSCRIRKMTIAPPGR